MKALDDMGAITHGYWRTPSLSTLQLAILGIMLFVGIPQNTWALEFTTDFHTLRLIGEIEKGDYEKFSKIVLGPDAEKIKEVYIASRGGDLAEAMKIGTLIRKLKYSTKVPNKPGIFIFIEEDEKDHVCTSACFFVYVAGIYRSGDKIGIHRPYLSVEQYKIMGVDDATSSYKSTKNKVSSYFKKMGIPPTYVERMMAIPKNSVEWLNESEVKTLSGDIHEVDEWLSAQCSYPFTEIEDAMGDQISQKRRENIPLTEAEKKVNEVLIKKVGLRLYCNQQTMRKISCDAWAELTKYKYIPGDSKDKKSYCSDRHLWNVQ